MNKNLLRVIVYGGYILVVVGLNFLLDQIIPIQAHEIFTAMGMVRLVIVFLIMYLGVIAVTLILRKYGAQIIPTPKTKKISIIILVASFVFLFAIFLVSFMNK